MSSICCDVPWSGECGYIEDDNFASHKRPCAQSVMLEIFEECFHLHVEHLCDYVWLLIGWLTLKELSCHFWSLGVSGEGQEVRYSFDLD